MHDFWSRFKSQVAEYFVFTSGEKRGTLYLLSFIIVLIAIMVGMNFMPQSSTDFTRFKQEINLIQKLETSDSSENKSSFVFKYDSTSINNFKNETAHTEAKLFKFDPNTIDADGWIKLGLSEKQAGVIIKYRSKGSRFYKKEDVKKVFVITDYFYSKIEPYISIDTIALLAAKNKDTLNHSTTQPYKPIDKKNISVELNTASQEELDQLPGVGQWIALSIIKYRDKLGGYVNKSQLLEVKYMTDSIYQIIQNQVTINLTYIKKININSSDFKSLLHPYIDYTTAGLISNYRKMHGNFKSVDDLKTTHLVDNETFEKLRPYVVVE